MVVSKRSNKIEVAAVSCVTDAFYQSQRLDPYIPTHDKEPVWDGNIYILHGNKGYSKIPSQVKGKCVKKLSTNPKFPVTIVNLENYKRDGGVAYFVVFIIDNEKRPYYHLLTPIDLKRYIKQANGQKEIAIPLRPLPEVTGEVENEFIQFFYDCKKQTSFSNNEVLSLEEVIKKGYPINYQIHGVTNSEDAAKYAASHYTYLYANIGDKDNKVLFPIGDQPYKIMMLSRVKQDVRCGDNTYFREYSTGQDDKHWEICIDECFRLTHNFGESESRISINLDNRNLERFYEQLSFIYDIYKNKELFLGEYRLDMASIKESDLKDVVGQYKYWTDIIETLRMVHCDLSRIDISKLEDQDFDNLSLLKRAILDKELIIQKHELSDITAMHFGPYKVLLWTKKVAEQTYSISDFFSIRSKYIFAVENSSGEKIASSIFSAVFMRDDFATFVNIDYKNFIKSYEEAARYSRDISNIANNDVLRMINGYDNATIRDERLLKYALKLTDWIAYLPEKEDIAFVYKLNRLQIKRRLYGLFSDEEKNELLDLSESDIPAFGKWAANILLGETIRAQRYWDKMTPDEQESYKEYPIYHFVSTSM